MHIILKKIEEETTLKELPKPQKPQHIKIPTFHKGEFETTKAFEDRIINQKRMILEDNKQIDFEFHNRIVKWEETNTRMEELHDKSIEKIDKNLIYLSFLEKAWGIKYGTPSIASIKYDADNEIFDIEVKSKRGKPGNHPIFNRC